MEQFADDSFRAPRAGDGDAFQALTVSDDRRRSELDGLLRMAEELQEGLENAGQRFLTNSLFLFVIVLMGLATMIAVVFTINDVAYKVGFEIVLVILVAVAALIQARNQAKFQVHQRRDKNALNEVLAILQEVEPILRATNDWSRLDEAAFRIRLSRLSVGRSDSARATAPIDRGMSKFTRTMRFLLEDANAHYRQLVEKLFQNIDVAVKNLMDARDFDDVISRAGARLEVLDDNVDFQQIVREGQLAAASPGGTTATLKTHVAWAQWGGIRNYAIFTDGRIVMTKASKRDFDARQEQLKIQLAAG